MTGIHAFRLVTWSEAYHPFLLLLLHHPVCPPPPTPPPTCSAPLTVTRWDEDLLDWREAPHLSLLITLYPVHYLGTSDLQKKMCKDRRFQTNGVRQILTCLMKGNLTIHMTKLSGCGLQCQIVAGENQISMDLSRQVPKRILALHLITHTPSLDPPVSPCLRTTPLSPTHRITLSRSSLAFLSLPPRPSPVSDAPSLCLSSCVYRTPTCPRTSPVPPSRESTSSHLHRNTCKGPPSSDSHLCSVTP